MGQRGSQHLIGAQLFGFKSHLLHKQFQRGEALMVKPQQWALSFNSEAFGFYPNELGALPRAPTILIKITLVTININMSKQCENCSKDIYNKWATPKTRFCSRTCSNLWRSQNIDVYDSISIDVKHQNEKLYVAQSLNEKVMLRDFDLLGWDYKRLRVILEQDNRCSKCQLDTWLGEKIALEIDHKDGNNKNNLRHNLEALCPNCHAQTKTYRGRNAIKGKFPSSIDFYKQYLVSGNIRQTLIFFGLAAKGGNYGKAKFLLQKEDPSLQFSTIVTY